MVVPSWSVEWVVPGISSCGGVRSERARYTALDLGALECWLPQADVVEGLDAGAPGVDLRPVDVAGRRRVWEEEGEGESWSTWVVAAA